MAECPSDVHVVRQSQSEGHDKVDANKAAFLMPGP